MVRVLLIAICSITSIIGLLGAVISCGMLMAASLKPSRQATVIVPGAAVRNGIPSRMLVDRLETVACYLDENSESICIVSGGKGRDETVSEADVMYAYLVNKQIAPDRIYRENQSHNTRENIQFSKNIIKQNHLNPRLVIVTQDFHQLRVQLIAKHVGFNEVSACTCHTGSCWLLKYWIREWAAICSFWVGSCLERH